MTEDYYRTLQVHPTASTAEIEQAYRRLVRTHHPDLLQGASQGQRQQSEALLKQVNRAYYVLSDHERRWSYDRQRQIPLSTTPRPGPASASAPATAMRTTHWQAGGPLDVEWSTPPPTQPRPADPFSAGRLLRYALVVFLLAIVLALILQPRLPLASSSATNATPVATVLPKR